MKKKILLFILFSAFNISLKAQNAQTPISVFGIKDSRSTQKIIEFFTSNKIQYHLFYLDREENQKKLVAIFHRKHPKKILISIPVLLMRNMMIFNPRNIDLLTIRKMIIENSFERGKNKCFPFLFSLNRYEVIWNQNFNISPYSKEDLKIQEERIYEIFPKLRNSLKANKSIYQRYSLIMNYIEIYNPSLKKFLTLKLYLKSLQLKHCQE